LACGPRIGGVPESDTGGGAGLSRVRLEHGEAEGMTSGTPLSVTAARRRRAGGGNGPKGQLGHGDGDCLRATTGCSEASWAGWLGRCAELLLRAAGLERVTG
jgi:hypothetical protein